mmetsp:Transcript_21229/g.30030  ORF Transcript_21229/g.30030 Transcript_21229/m.30030 type:complete len:237 (-) Transcript_21229:86-796(-)
MPGILGSKELSSAITSEKWQYAIDFCRSSPKAARTWSSREGFFEGAKTADVLPIHEACANGAPIEVVQALIDAFEEGIHRPESAYNRLPLHIACRKNANIEVIRVLMEKFPKAALEPDNLGRLPLHYALSNGIQDEGIDILMQEPNAARGTDRRGWIPLHVACQTGSSTRIVKVLLEAYPEGIVEMTNKGTDVFECISHAVAPNKFEVAQLLQKAKIEWERNWRPTTKRESELLLL